MPFEKVRIRFRKTGDARLISHLDLSRCLERILRRAALPFRVSEGFHPLPRMVFALSLPLGTAGLNEVVELELTEPFEPEEVLRRLREQSPPGLEFVSARGLERRVTARPRRAVYHFPLSDFWVETVRPRCIELLENSEIWVPRYRPTPKQLNIRPYIHDLRCEGDALIIDLWLSQDGSARAEEILRLLDLHPLLDEGFFVTRTELELLDELSAEEIARLPVLPSAETRSRFERPLEPSDTRLEPEPATNSVLTEWGASPNGPVVE